MKDFTKRYSILVVGASFILSAVCGSYLPAVAGNTAQVSDKRTVRVTTGIQQVSGWEQGLVRGNPNLARWHWDPIYSYKQGLGRVGPEPLSVKDGQRGNKVSGNSAGSAYKYNIPPQQDNRPVHIPFSSKALAEVQAKLAQPVRPRNENNVYGKLSNQATQAKIISPTVATYGSPYTSKELNTSLKYSSDKTAVYGELLNEKQKAAYHRTKVSKQRTKK
jgi:hypothetical protein